MLWFVLPWSSSMLCIIVKTLQYIYKILFAFIYFLGLRFTSLKKVSIHQSKKQYADEYVKESSTLVSHGSLITCSHRWLNKVTKVQPNVNGVGLHLLLSNILVHSEFIYLGRAHLPIQVAPINILLIIYPWYDKEWMEYRISNKTTNIYDKMITLMRPDITMYSEVCPYHVIPSSWRGWIMWYPTVFKILSTVEREESALRWRLWVRVISCLDKFIE